VADLNGFLAGDSRTPIAGAPALVDVTEPIGHPGWLPDGDLLFAGGDVIYRAALYSRPADWQVVAPREEGALHPAPGATWYWPQPVTGPVRLNP
jgi:hypothetical protein